MPRIPPTPALFDNMFAGIGSQDLDLLVLPGQTLADLAATFIQPADADAAVAFLDKLLDGRASPVDLRTWVNHRCRDISFKDARMIEAALHELRDILAVRPPTPPKRPVAKRHSR
jgi:hypothetical protein